jgi:hypothetical protein
LQEGLETFGFGVLQQAGKENRSQFIVKAVITDRGGRRCRVLSAWVVCFRYFEEAREGGAAIPLVQASCTLI